MEVVWEAPAGAGFEEKSDEHTSAYVSDSIRQRQHTSAYVGIHQRRRERPAGAGLEEERYEGIPKILERSPTPAYTQTHTHTHTHIIC